MALNWMRCSLLQPDSQKAPAFEMTRAFIALDMNASLQQFLGSVIQRLSKDLPSVRWVHPASIHLTLVFLGNLDPSQLEEVREAMNTTAGTFSLFDYHLSHVGFFGPARQPEIIWIGVEEPTGILQRLYRFLLQDLERRGFSIRKRPFSPHLTLARLKAPLPQSERQALLANSQILSSPSYHATGLDLMKSELFRSGARYTRLQAFTFPAEKRS